MSIKSLKLTYYVKENGESDEIVNLLGSCFDENLFLVMKNKLGNIKDPFPFFLNDITLGLRLTSEEKITRGGIFTGWININSDLFSVNTQVIRHDYKKAFSVLEGLLDSGEVVMVTTVCEELPFKKRYGDSYNPNYDEHNHIFIIIWHDKEYFYYVEKPYDLHPLNFVPYKENRGVGIARKEDFIKAFGILLVCRTIDFYENDLQKVNSRIIPTIQEMIKKYNNEQVNFGEDGFKYYYGRNAIKKIIDICNKEYFYINEGLWESPEYIGTLTFEKQFEWNVDLIVNRRTILSKVIANLQQDANGLTVNLLNTINSGIQSWVKTRNIITKRFFSGRYLLDASIGKYFENVLNIEDELFECLKNYIIKCK